MQPLRMSMPRLAAVLLLSSLGACASVSERWAETRFEDISYPSLYNVVLTTVDAEGFTVRHRHPESGRIESDWVYGTSLRELRGPSRRKVHAEIITSESGGYIVRVRVAEEVVRKGGLLAVNVRESEEWESYKDNYDDAEYLMAKIAALLSAHHDGIPRESDGRP